MKRDAGAPNDLANDLTVHYSSETGEQPVMAVLEAISEATGADVSELEPLSQVIDPDALNDLFGGSGGNTDFYRSSSRSTERGPEATFAYQGFVVTVSSNTVRVAQP